ncbi:FecR family protein [Sphingobacterium faecium]|uniref:FecR family protein n=1 Tax=Sphingobacterium faecium TaxID=34087 RepID=UPI003DA34CCD
MMNTRDRRIILLANKWLEQRITNEEIAEFNQWYSEGLDHPVFVGKNYAASDEDLRDRIYSVIQQQIHRKKRKNYWMRAVAAVFLMLNLGVALYVYRNHEPDTVAKAPAIADIRPGTDQATLILADGRRIPLSDAASGRLAEQSGVAISKTADGQLIYAITGATDAAPTDKVIYNTIETPQGGQYQVKLPDGTHVWLNAASSLRYPTSFPKIGHREVALTYGEAYFEVSHDEDHTFVLSSGRQDIEVIGTKFNITAYPEDNLIKTTLLKGKVKVTDRLSKKEVWLQPGQQSILQGDDLRVKTMVEVSSQLWKDGKFYFDNEKMSSIMQQISRWYKVKVVFQDPVEEVQLSGSVSRFDKLSTLLEKLEQTGLVRFKREDDQLMVLKPE